MKMTKDEFAEFMAKQILRIDFYQFDVLYDIKKIIDQLSANRGITNKPVRTELHLMIRSTGCEIGRAHV